MSFCLWTKSSPISTYLKALKCHFGLLSSVSSFLGISLDGLSSDIKSNRHHHRLLILSLISTSRAWSLALSHLFRQRNRSLKPRAFKNDADDGRRAEEGGRSQASWDVILALSLCFYFTGILLNRYRSYYYYHPPPPLLSTTLSCFIFCTVTGIHRLCIYLLTNFFLSMEISWSTWTNLFCRKDRMGSIACNIGRCMKMQLFIVETHNFVPCNYSENRSVSLRDTQCSAPWTMNKRSEISL